MPLVVGLKLPIVEGMSVCNSTTKKKRYIPENPHVGGGEPTALGQVHVEVATDDTVVTSAQDS